MSKYLFQVNYVGALAKGLLEEGGTARFAALETGVASLGGTLDAFYYAFGDTDVYAIADYPDHATAIAAVMTAKAIGFECTATLLLSLEEVDEAAKKSPVYRPPGQ